MIKKKIGILTFHRTTNFGSLLQTYGLFKKIENLGYDCEIIDYRCPAVEKRENLNTSINFFNIKSLIKYFLFQKTINKKGDKLKEFLNDNMRISSSFFPEEMSKVEGQYDKIIVGSDIVWGRDITENDYTYFLDFVEDKEKKYAFASSVGDYKIRGDEACLSKLFKDFKRIAIREEETIKWMKDLAQITPELVCDPTMLLTAEEWLNIIKPKQVLKKYVFVYFNSDNNKCLKDAIKYAKIHNLKVAYINYGLPVKGVINVKPVSLEEFLGFIYYSDMVFTASYHGLLFSLYFNKEFLFYTRAHKARMLSLAKKLEIMTNCGDNFNLENYVPIEYKKVNNVVHNFREESIKILNEMLIE